MPRLGWTTIVVDEHADRRGVEIVELAEPGRPDEADHRAAGDREHEGEQEIDHAHRDTSRRKARDQAALVTTEIEEAGIIRAATRGWIRPVTASAAPARL